MSNNQDLINFQNKLYNETGNPNNDLLAYLSNSGKNEIDNFLTDDSSEEDMPPLNVDDSLSYESPSESEEDSMPPLVDVVEQNKKSVLNSKQNKSQPESINVMKKMNEEASKISINNVEITTDGISHDVYSTLSFQNKMKIGKSIGFCEACNKYYPDFIVVEHDTIPYCWHCLFWLTSTNMFSSKELEQTYGLSLGKYIEFCEPTHNSDACFRKDECILCNNHKTDILDSDEQEDCGELILELDI